MRRLVWVLVTLCAALVLQAQMFAQQTSDFVPIDPATEATERLPAAPMVMAAYALVWIVLVAYIWSLRRRQARVELEIAALRARISAESSAPSRGMSGGE